MFLKYLWAFIKCLLLASIGLLLYYTGSNSNRLTDLFAKIFGVSISGYMLVYLVLLVQNAVSASSVRKIELNKKALHVICREISETLFPTSERSRVTIFKKSDGLKIWQCCVFFKRWLWAIPKHFKRKALLNSLKNFPIPFTKNLYIVARHGIPYKKGTTTVFKCPESHDDVRGVVPKAFLTGKVQKILTVHFNEKERNEILSTDNFSSLKQGYKQKVRQYIDDTCACYENKCNHDKCAAFSNLRRFHCLPSIMIAIPISKESETVGVLCVDTSDSSSDKIFTDEKLVNLYSYARLIEQFL